MTKPPHLVYLPRTLPDLGGTLVVPVDCNAPDTTATSLTLTMPATNVVATTPHWTNGTTIRAFGPTPTAGTLSPTLAGAGTSFGSGTGAYQLSAGDHTTTFGAGTYAQTSAEFQINHYVNGGGDPAYDAVTAADGCAWILTIHEDAVVTPNLCHWAVYSLNATSPQGTYTLQGSREVLGGGTCAATALNFVNFPATLTVS